MTKPWLETWRSGEAFPSSDRERRLVVLPIEGVAGHALVVTHETHAVRKAIDAANAALPERAKLIAAAPAMVRLLLHCEYATQEHEMGSVTQCSCCGASRIERAPKHLGPDGKERWWTRAPHEPDCALDAQLTELGFDTAEKRDAARADIATMKAGAA